MGKNECVEHWKREWVKVNRDPANVLRTWKKEEVL